MTLSRTGLALAALLAMPVAHACELIAADPWIRAAPPTAGVMAGYVTLSNPGTAAVAVTAAGSDAFGAIELHEMAMDGDVMRMRRVQRIEVPAGGEAKLAPGGLHLMLFRPVAPLAVGESATLSLTLDCGAVVDVTFPVREAKAAGAHHGQH
jgi:periplasmic copper chaperone A